MKKTVLSILMAITLISTACKKKDTCDYDMCDDRRITVMTATDWRGLIGYNNELKKWTINAALANTIDGLRTCIICTNIPDSFKVSGKVVEFSGNLKESCNNPRPQLGGEEIYYIKPTKIK